MYGLANVAGAPDTASTLVGLASGAVETNPLVGMSPAPAAILGLTALKIACLNSMVHDPDRTDLQKITALCNAYAVVGAASYNNLAVVAGGIGALPALIGIGAGRYQYDNCVVNAAAQPTRAESAERNAMSNDIKAMVMHSDSASALRH